MSAIAWIEWCVVPPAAPRTNTGRCARSRARSSVVRMMQQPPSEITQQSSLCSGSATSFDAEHVVDGDRIAVHRVRVARRVLARLHRDRRELLRLRAELVHVPLRGHRVRADEREPGRELVAPSAAASPCPRARRRRRRCRACGPTPTAGCCRRRSRRRHGTATRACCRCSKRSRSKTTRAINR